MISHLPVLPVYRTGKRNRALSDLPVQRTGRVSFLLVTVLPVFLLILVNNFFIYGNSGSGDQEISFCVSLLLLFGGKYFLIALFGLIGLVIMTENGW